MNRLLALLLALVLGIAAAGWAQDDAPIVAEAPGADEDGADEPDEELAEVVERLDKAAETLGEIMDAPDKGIPGDLLDRCACIAVIPSMKKGGLGIGARYGKGAVACRRKDGSWGPPSMITLGGGSVGLQIGFTSVDVVMLVMNRDGMQKLLRDKFTLGGDVSVAAGPVGRAGSAETDALMTAKILTYSRAKGLFAGLELKGAVVKQDRDANHALYGRRVEAKRLLLDGKARVPDAAARFIATLAIHSPARTRKAL